jgi:hypothetical protein
VAENSRSRLNAQLLFHKESGSQILRRDELRSKVPTTFLTEERRLCEGDILAGAPRLPTRGDARATSSAHLILEERHNE